ncbi:MAG TPA: AzlC family ABC transporter permease [Burkholderiales bacterium]|jgi:predicted branched-subunit amino acid permease|nr:AzlC family ABC transporter permease [Burkholderiales bacterium]
MSMGGTAQPPESADPAQIAGALKADPAAEEVEHESARHPAAEAGGRQYRSGREAYLGGMRAVLPFLFGTIPFGLVTGIATKAAGLSAAAAVAMTTMVFAGTAQIASLPLLVSGAPGFVVVLTAFIINLRFVIYSATAAPYFKHLPLRWRFVLGYFMTDTGFALFLRRVAGQPEMDFRQYYFLGSGTTVATIWLITAAVGVFAGAKVPPGWQLEFAATLGILALLAPFVRSKPDFAAAATGGAVALLASGLPMKLGLVAGALAGIAAGVAAEQVFAPRPKEAA